LCGTFSSISRCVYICSTIYTDSKMVLKQQSIRSSQLGKDSARRFNGCTYLSASLCPFINRARAMLISYTLSPQASLSRISQFPPWLFPIAANSLIIVNNHILAHVGWWTTLVPFSRGSLKILERTNPAIYLRHIFFAHQCEAAAWKSPQDRGKPITAACYNDLFHIKTSLYAPIWLLLGMGNWWVTTSCPCIRWEMHDKESIKLAASNQLVRAATCAGRGWGWGKLGLVWARTHMGTICKLLQMQCSGWKVTTWS
jgi:hypothetical protein